MKSTILLPLVVVLATFDYSPVYAASDDDFDESLVAEIIVTARKREERLQEVPASISAFSERLLDERGILNLEDIADATPGFDYAQAFGRADFRPAIRGQSNILGRANAGLFVDGTIIEAGNATLPLAALERVEVVKGPQSALYGRSTLAGAVNYVLKKPGDEFTAEVMAEVAERDYTKLEAHFSGAVTDTLGVALTLSGYQRGGEYDNAFSETTVFGAPTLNNEVGGEDTNSAILVVDFAPSDRFSLTSHLIIEDTNDDPYAIGVLPSSFNNCFRPGVDTDQAGNTLSQPSPPAGTPESAADIVGSPAYNSSGYFCGEVGINDILGSDNATNIETSFFNDAGLQQDTRRLGVTANYDISDSWTLTGVLGYNDVETISRQDQTFGTGDIRFPVVGVGSPFAVQGFGVPLTVQSRVGFQTLDDDEFEDFSQELRLSFSGDSVNGLVGFYNYSSEQTELAGGSFDDTVSVAPNGTRLFAPFSPAFTPASISVVPFFTNTPLIDEGTTDIDSRSIFASIEAMLSDTWTLDAELRYNRDTIKFSPGAGSTIPGREADFDAWLPKLTLSNQVNENLLYYFGVGVGNKPGDLNTARGVEPADVDVEEETATTFEVGVKSELLDGRLIANAALYRINWEDLQLTSTRAAEVDGNTLTFSILENVGEATINGFELELGYAVTDSWNMSLGYAYTDSEIDRFLISVDAGASAGSSFRESALIFGYQSTGDVNITGTQLPQTSKDQLNFSNTFNGQLGSTGWSWYARADVNYNSERYAQVYNLASTGDRTVVNARLGFQSDTFDIEFWAANLFDDDTPIALIRYVEPNDATFNPFNRAIGATLPERQRFGVTARARF